MDRAQLADFLRTRRESLSPEDVGLPRGSRRRTGGLRREEVAALSGMSTDYYTRIEQQRGSHPSEQILAALARGMHLSLDERDHLFRLAGHPAPERVRRSDHVDAGLMRILDRLSDTPAMVIGPLGETLLQTPPAVALFGNETEFEGLERYAPFRFFTRKQNRNLYPEEDRSLRGRQFAADLRTALARDGAGSRAQEVVDALLARSAEFAAIWAEHEVGRKHSQLKRLIHPEVGELEVYCQTLYDIEQLQGLLVFTATPGTPSYEKLQLLSVIGAQILGS
ncbi:helix-turn-helix domain-containing protein [Nakamurella sp. YIM 132087]|uniref:Helix-turn-helix domain-containing protein n=1 Tax=Nakamurella alba TaxID=2665158 RepID=A0A7K1FSC5_9ACTN|nr:helix-turn-helix domain-containing protein [Nakamurella alba]